MAPRAEKEEVIDMLAATLSRLHDLLAAEKQAVDDLDRKRMDEVEAGIAQVMQEKAVLLARLRRLQDGDR